MVMPVPKIPPFKATTLQSYTRRRHGRVSEQEWLDANEYFLSDLWYSFEKFAKECNPFVLDQCRYTDFCNFIAKHSTHFAD
ncbi:FirrV-1-B40 [Feldmannia irregularis virus a]|uniref:FirrV-1-B40 n=1 Tax=Feldmannia irregularis virus a TaxID=231992 RepID=Q6XLZ6_9PHYC|nr:FirrV-1-B40 [Feldmannia irregularis virus a]AAR26915.1 FirrV-1-B40 [Feldmannia irregularis virus a]